MTLKEAGPPIEFHRPYYGKRVVDHVTGALAAASLHGNGKTVMQLEEELSALVGTPVLLTPSCTSALEIAAQTIGIEPGDEVIVPGYTFLSSGAAFTAQGARIVFVDITPDTLSIDCAAIEAAVTPRTRAIIPVHYAGQAAPLAKLTAIAERNGLAIIEDAAQGFLCRQGQTWLGRAGALGCYSFHDTKVFSAGEGGALVINDPALLDRAVRIREKGSNRREFLSGRVDKYGWVAQGTSGYMGGLSAALLAAQLEERDAIIAHRQALHETYAAILSAPLDALGIGMFTPRDGERLTYHIFWLMLRSSEEAESLRAHLAAQHIAASGHYPALHRSDFARNTGFLPNRELPVTDRAATHLLRLPLHFHMSTSDAARIAEAVLNFLQGQSP